MSLCRLATSTCAFDIFDFTEFQRALSILVHILVTDVTFATMRTPYLARAVLTQSRSDAIEAELFARLPFPIWMKLSSFLSWMC